MILSPAEAILFFACVFIVLALIVMAVDLIEARARKRRAVRRRRLALIEPYSVNDGRQPFDVDGLVRDQNVVPFPGHSVKVS